MKYASYILLSFLIAACSSTSISPSISLKDIPHYDVARANKEWRKIEELNQSWAKYAQIIGMMEQQGIVFGQPERDAINLQLDVFLFHKAVATVYLFHGDYESMAQSIAAAMKGLDAVETLIIDAIEGQRV